MTKNEAADLGSIQGAQWFETTGRQMVSATATPDSLANVVTLAASVACAVACSPANSRSAARESFTQAFTTAASQRLRNFYWELPEVKAETRMRYVQRHVAGVLESCADTFAKFTADFAKNPNYAMKWSDGTMRAAAQLDVYTRLSSIIDAPENGGLDVAFAYAREQAMRYARYNNHSTSPISNLMAELEAAAYAEFAEYDRQ